MFFRKKEQGISQSIKEKLDELAEKGNVLYEKGENNKALQVWTEALNLIPEPRNTYSESVWFLTSIGDVYFCQGEYKTAYDYLYEAKSNLSGQGYNNPFIMLRLGESALEIKDEKNAIEYMLRAYMLAGKEIFDDEDEKYFLFLKMNTNLENI